MVEPERAPPVYEALFFSESTSHDDDVKKACTLVSEKMEEFGYTDEPPWGADPTVRKAMKCLKALPELYEKAVWAHDAACDAVLSQAQDMAHARMKSRHLDEQVARSSENFWVFSDLCDDFLAELAPEVPHWPLSEEVQAKLLETMTAIIDAQRGFDRDSEEMDVLASTLNYFGVAGDNALLGREILASGNPVYDRQCEEWELFELAVPHESRPFSAERFRKCIEELASGDVEVIFSAYTWARKSLLARRMQAGSGVSLELAKQLLAVIEKPQ